MSKNPLDTPAFLAAVQDARFAQVVDLITGNPPDSSRMEEIQVRHATYMHLTYGQDLPVTITSKIYVLALTVRPEDIDTAYRKMVEFTKSILPANEN